MMKFTSSFAQWSDRLDRIEKKVGAKVRTRKVAGGILAFVGKEQVGSFTFKVGGYTYC